MKAVISKTLAKILANAESRHHLGKLLANGDYEAALRLMVSAIGCDGLKVL